MTMDGLTYLDHNATTPAKSAVRDLMLEILALPGNASSIHKMGREARRRIEESRLRIAKLVNASPRATVIFTSGATEANNLALRGAPYERVLVSAIEHSSVLHALPQRELIPVLPSGLIDLDALDKMLAGNDRLTLVSVMWVNNETGVIQPIEKVVEIARKRGALVHSDAVQAAGKLPIDMKKTGVDFLTLSSHKMGGPQGAGCLILSGCMSVAPMIVGGGQENGLRAGTENLAAVAGFGLAADLAAANIGEFRKLGAWRDKIESALIFAAPSLKVFGKDAPRVANTSMFCLPGLSSETQLIALDLAGVCVSSGSACSSGTVRSSHVLRAMGAGEAEASSSLRVSLGWNTTEKEVDAFVSEWKKMYERVKSRLSAA